MTLKQPGPGSRRLPVHADALDVAAWKRASDAARKGRIGDAIDELGALLSRDPHFVPGLVQLAVWKLGADQCRDAHALVLRAAAHVSGASPELLLEVLRLLKVFQECELADALIEQLGADDVPQATLVAIAVEAGALGLHHQAERLVDIAGRREPGSPRVAQVRGIIRMVSGDMEGAREALGDVAALGTFAEAQANWLLSLQPRMERDLRAWAETLRAHLRKPGQTPESEALWAYALHNVLYAAGADEEAWQALERGCQARLRQVRYDRQGSMELFDALHAMPRLRAEAEREEQAPGLIFVVGMHRSGTTLLEHLLAGHPAVADGGESYAFQAALRLAGDHYFPGVLDLDTVRRGPCLRLDSVAATYRRYARWKSAGRPWLTEKLPGNFLGLGFILAAFPQARILHMRRDPVDTCFSNLRTCFAPGAAPYSYDQGNLAEYYLRYQALMRHWHELWPGRILDVDYHALVDEPELQARKVLAYCGLDFVPAVLELSRGRVATASLADVRTGIRKDRGGQWRRFERQLQPLVTALTPAYNNAA